MSSQGGGSAIRLGVFGGSFNPVHMGHLILAEQCREHAKLDQVWFVPASTPPHKRDQLLASAKQRVEMLQLAVSGNLAFSVSCVEIDRGGVSYTVDTLSQIRAAQPAAALFFLMGADSLRDFPTWRQPARILELATPLVVRRGGEPEPDLETLRAYLDQRRLSEVRSLQIHMPAVDISSSAIRGDVAAGRTIRYRVPRAVEQYICAHALYAGRQNE